jgi:hypothetical protein
MYQPFAFNKTEVATIAPGPAPTPMVQLPSGAVVVYDFTNPSCWPGSGSIVFDLSGNGISGSFVGNVSSASVGALSFKSSDAALNVGVGNSRFNTAFFNRKQLFASTQYNTGSFGKYTTIAGTWTSANGTSWFTGVNTTQRADTGVQVQNSGGGSGYIGSYNTGANNSIPTGKHTYSMMANITSGSAISFIDNTSTVSTITGINTARFFVWTGTSATSNGARIGNRDANENFEGDISKFVMYNRALSPDERGVIEAWMTSSAPTDYFPVNLNAGLIGRWEVANPNSWPGTGTTLNNLATGSQFSGLYAMAMTSSAISRNDGVQFRANTTGRGQGLLFGVTGSFDSGSYALNSAIIGNTNQFTVMTICNVSSSAEAGCALFQSWTDYQDQDFWLIGRDNVTAARTNNSFNTATITGYTDTNVIKCYGARVAIGASANRFWKGTAQFGASTISGTTWGTTLEQGKKATWAFGSNFNAAIPPNSMNRSIFQGNWYASYIWNRQLSDAEMLQLQTYTNKFIAANS